MPGLKWDQESFSVSIGSQGQTTQGELHLVSLHGFPEFFIKTRYQPTKALLKRFLIWVDQNLIVSSG